MPILNRFAKAPRAWPPPRTPEEIGDCLRFAEERDPVGTSVHLVLAMLFCASITLSTAMTSVSFVLLVGYTVLRLPNVWQALMPLLVSPLTWCWLLWAAWTALNGFWSADLERWRDTLGSFWCVALIPAVFPIVRHWRSLLVAFVVGAVLQGMIQIGQAFGWIPIPANTPYRPPGMGSHPGHVTISAAIAILICLAFAREARSPRGRGIALIATSIAATSVVLAAGRGAILGLGTGLVALAVSTQWRFGVAWRSPSVFIPLLGAVTATAILAGLTWIGRGPTSLSFQLEGLGRTELREASSVSKRFLWWSVSLDALREHPLFGIGSGSMYQYSFGSAQVAAVSKESGIPLPELAARHPHSHFLLNAAEQGMVGIGFLLATTSAALLGAWRSTRVRPVACGAFSGMLVWLVAAQFDCLNLPLRTASMFMLLAVIVAVPRGPGVGLRRWTGPSKHPIPTRPSCR